MPRDKKVQEELERYAAIEHVHDLPPVFHYWAENFLYPKCRTIGLADPADLYRQYLLRALTRGKPSPKIVSIGAGNCDTEIGLAEFLIENDIRDFSFTCLDINPRMLERGRSMVHDRQLTGWFKFHEDDIGEWHPLDTYEIVIANHSLHHVVELERLFDNIHRSLSDDGWFLTNDMIGRNGHMRWPESLETLLALWSLLDDKHKLNHATGQVERVYENFDSSGEGFEGIRSQDILPLLLKTFHFETFLGFNNLIGPFIERNFGPNFDAGDGRDRNFIDLVAGLDDYYIEVGKLKPTQVLAAMTKQPSAVPRVYKHLTPEFCLRPPDLEQNLVFITDPNPYALKLPFMTKLKRRGFHKAVPAPLRARLKGLISGK